MGKRLWRPDSDIAKTQDILPQPPRWERDCGGHRLEPPRRQYKPQPPRWERDCGGEELPSVQGSEAMPQPPRWERDCGGSLALMLGNNFARRSPRDGKEIVAVIYGDEATPVNAPQPPRWERDCGGRQSRTRRANRSCRSPRDGKEIVAGIGSSRHADSITAAAPAMGKRLWRAQGVAIPSLSISPQPPRWERDCGGCQLLLTSPPPICRSPRDGKEIVAGTADISTMHLAPAAAPAMGKRLWRIKQGDVARVSAGRSPYDGKEIVAAVKVRSRPASF